MSSAAPEQRRAEQRGWVWYDWANSAFPTSVVTVFLALYLTEVAVTAAEHAPRNGPNPCPGGSSLTRCDIALFGATFPAGSLWGYLLAAATAVQVLVLPIVGSIADGTGAKRGMLAAFAFTGAALTVLLALVADGNWQLAVALFIPAAICYGSSLVVYYSLLPQIADADERDAVSSRGWAFGYLGGGLALAAALAVVLGNDALGLSASAAVRVCFVLTGLWWAGFTLIPLARLRAHGPAHRARGARVVTAGFQQLAATLREARSFPLTLGFLAAYLLFADGVVTVQKVAAQYGDQQLGLDRNVLIGTVLVVQFVAFPGALLHGRLAARYGAKHTIMGSLLIWIALLAGAFFLQPGRPWQFLALAVGIGIVLGGTLALSRALFSQLIPPGREGAYFSVYLISERGTAWLGPLLYAAIAQLTGSFRWAILSVMAFFIVGFVLLSLVPVRRAIRAAGNPQPAVV